MARSARVDQSGRAMLGGRSCTRLEPDEPFGITGPTLRWATSSTRDAGHELELHEVPDPRGANLKRWRVVAPNAVSGSKNHQSARAKA